MFALIGAEQAFHVAVITECIYKEDNSLGLQMGKRWLLVALREGRMNEVSRQKNDWAFVLATKSSRSQDYHPRIV